MESISRLQEGKWLNDEVINFYMTMLEDWSKHSDNCRTYIFSTFFMDKLRQNIEDVRMWRSRRRKYFVDVWSVQQLLVPIHVGNNHWTLLAVYPQLSTMTYYDSLHCDGSVYFSAMTDFFKMRAMTAKEGSMKWQVNNITNSPRQPNPNDCGVYCIINACLLTKGQSIHAASYGDLEAKIYRKKNCISICKGYIYYL
jgi:Ulp1 family protease